MVNAVWGRRKCQGLLPVAPVSGPPCGTRLAGGRCSSRRPRPPRLDESHLPLSRSRSLSGDSLSGPEAPPLFLGGSQRARCSHPETAWTLAPHSWETDPLLTAETLPPGKCPGQSQGQGAGSCGERWGPCLSLAVWEVTHQSGDTWLSERSRQLICASPSSRASDSWSQWAPSPGFRPQRPLVGLFATGHPEDDKKVRQE